VLFASAVIHYPKAQRAHIHKLTIAINAEQIKRRSDWAHLFVATPLQVFDKLHVSVIGFKHYNQHTHYNQREGQMLISTIQAAEILQTSRDTVVRLCESGELRFARIRAQSPRRIYLDELLAYAEKKGIVIPDKYKKQ